MRWGGEAEGEGWPQGRAQAAESCGLTRVSERPPEKTPGVFHFIGSALSPNHFIFSLLVSGKRRCLFCFGAKFKSGMWRKRR
jgi:hypothetical protein